jgi:Flp pilus assembly CpaF family ATPase
VKRPEPNAMDASLDRRIRMLRTAMGPEIAAALDDPEVVEVLLNPDGSLWVDRLGTGREATGTALPPAVAERIIRLVAAHVRTEVHAGAPIRSCLRPANAFWVCCRPSYAHRPLRSESVRCAS